jgi:hypothetical protein
VTVLSRRSYIGIAKETTQGTYAAPSFYIPVTSPVGEDVFVPIRDESYRGNDTVLQGLYQGPGDSAVSWDMMAYPDATGYILRSIIGPDTVTPGTSTTLASNCAAGATTLSLTASVPSNSTIQISDAAGANLEWVGVGTVTGSGPYSAPVASPVSGTRFAHTAAGGSVVSQSSHAFAQSPTAAQVSYTIVKYDVAVNSGTTSTRAFTGCKLSECAVKIDPKGAVTLSPKWIGWLSSTQANPTPTFTSLQPVLGWQWSLTDGGAASTRGLTYDVTFKRTGTEAIHASTGQQGPREVFQGGFEADGTLKSIFESDADLSLFLNYTQLPVVNALAQPAPSGGMALTLTHSRGGLSKGVVDATGTYLTGSFDLSAIYNGTDAGAVTATLTNYSSTAY